MQSDHWQLSLFLTFVISCPKCCSEKTTTWTRLNVSASTVCVLAHRVQMCVRVQKKWAVLKHFTDGFWVVVSMKLQTHCIVCVTCELVFGQSHTEGGDAESTCEGWWCWLLWTMPLCPSCPDPLPSLFSGRPGARSVLSAQFSPWEISDVKRSARLPFNP